MAQKSATDRGNDAAAVVDKIADLRAYCDIAARLHEIITEAA